MSGVVRRYMVVSAFHKIKLIYRKSLNLYGNIFMFHNGAARLFTSTCYATVAARHTFIRCSFFWVSSQETFRTLFNVQSLPSWLAQTYQHKQYYLLLPCKRTWRMQTRETKLLSKKRDEIKRDEEIKNVTSESEIEFEWKYENKWSLTTLLPTAEHRAFEFKPKI